MSQFMPIFKTIRTKKSRECKHFLDVNMLKLNLEQLLFKKKKRCFWGA